MDFFRRRNWDIIRYTWLWFGLSALVVVVGMVAWATQGLNYGIDFTGGSLLRYRFEKPLITGPGTDAQVIGQTRDMLTKLVVGKNEIQVAGVDSLYIRTHAVANDEEARQRDEKVRAGLVQLFGKEHGDIEQLGRETVGPVIGVMLRRSAIQALVLGIALILIYITIRYEFRFAVAAVIALLHDTLVIAGAVALLQVELNTWFVAAILTVLGYSMNDTVIIFDRIRENRSLHRRAPLASIVNTSLLQTMARSINTVLTTLFTLIALFVLGGATIHGFAFTLIIGIITGCYSSIFSASPIVVLWYRLADRSRRAPEARPAVAARAAVSASLDSQTEADQPEVRRPSARETMREAERAAQEEKRDRRRDRRSKKTKKDASGKRKKRF